MNERTARIIRSESLIIEGNLDNWQNLYLCCWFRHVAFSLFSMLFSALDLCSRAGLSSARLAPELSFLTALQPLKTADAKGLFNDSPYEDYIIHIITDGPRQHLRMNNPLEN